MNKNCKRAVGVSLVAALGACAAAMASNALTNYLVSVALDRKEPKIPKKSRERLCGAKNLQCFDINDAEGERRLEEKCVKVEIEGFDGERLVGHWYRAENQKRVIVAMHGWRSGWKSDFVHISDFWHENGCSVLYAEQRGQSESGGDYMGFGLVERFDCFKWIKWVEDEVEENVPIYLGGVSMGASTVLMTAGFDLPDCVKGIVADCGYTAPSAVWRHVLEKNMGLSYNVRRRAVNRLCMKKIKCGAEDYSAVSAMKKCRVPVLFIHGTDDGFVPIEMTYENYKACNGKKRLFVVPGAEHAMSYFVDKSGYEREVKEFWKECEENE